MMVRGALILLVMFLSTVAGWTQTAFDPASIAYIVCVPDEAKKLALKTPPLADSAILDQAARACADQERAVRKSLAGRGLAPEAIDGRLSGMKKTARQAAQSAIDRIRSSPALPRSKQSMTHDEMTALARHLEKCWAMVPNVTKVERRPVELLIKFKKDGTLSAPPEVIKEDGDAVFQKFAEVAVRAVVDCQPYKMLPLAKYELWKELRLDFTPPR